MTYFSGSRGALFIDEGPEAENRNVWYEDPVAKVIGWTLTANTETIDVTTLMDTDRVIVPSLKNYNGTAEILYYKAAGTGGPKYAEILNRVFAARKPDSTPNDNRFDNTGISEVPTSIGLKLMITDYNPAYTGVDPGPDDDRPEKKNLFIDVRAVITSASISQQTADVCRGSIQFQCSGAPLEFQF